MLLSPLRLVLPDSIPDGLGPETPKAAFARLLRRFGQLRGLPGSYGDSYAGTSGTGLLNPISFLGDGIVYLLWQETQLKSRKNSRGKQAFLSTLRKQPRFLACHAPRLSPLLRFF
jgi:hypothetical protein